MLKIIKMEMGQLYPFISEEDLNRFYPASSKVGKILHNNDLSEDLKISQLEQLFQTSTTAEKDYAFLFRDTAYPYIVRHFVANHSDAFIKFVTTSDIDTIMFLPYLSFTDIMTCLNLRTFTPIDVWIISEQYKTRSPPAPFMEWFFPKLERMFEDESLNVSCHCSEPLKAGFSEWQNNVEIVEKS